MESEIILREKRDSSNNLLEKLEDIKSEWYDSGASPLDMRRIRKMIRRVIFQRDKCDDKLGELGEVRLIMTPI